MAKQTFTTGQVLTAAQMTSLQQTAMGGGSTTAKTASYVLVAADAGTVVQMNSASATTITVNTALFAAGDTVQIQNVGAGVCTVTAGTATVSTSAVLALKQYDAGSLYFNSTSAALFFAADAADNTSPLTTKGDLYTYSTTNARLGVGTDAQILVADSTASTGLKWATPASGTTYVGCSVSNSASQNVADATETTMTFDTEQWDTNSIHSTSSNTGRFTVPSSYAGKWQLALDINTGNGGVSTEFYIYVNGSYFISGFPQVTILQNGRGTALATLTMELNLSVSDYVEIKAWQNSGGTAQLRGQYSRVFFSYIGA